MKKVLSILAVIAIAASFLTFAGCGNKAEDTVLDMATNAAFPPYEFKGDDGNFAGIDIEIAGKIAEKLGMTLKVHDVDFDTSSFIVTRKGGDQQEIFMPVQVENELHLYMLERLEMENVKDTDALFVSRLGKRMTAQGVEKTLKKYCRAVGITDPDKARPHALRRTFACNMIADGIDIKMVAELMGHKNIEVTHRYYAQYASQKRKEVMRNYEVIKKSLL